MLTARLTSQTYRSVSSYARHWKNSRTAITDPSIDSSYSSTSTPKFKLPPKVKCLCLTKLYVLVKRVSHLRSTELRGVWCHLGFFAHCATKIENYYFTVSKDLKIFLITIIDFNCNIKTFQLFVFKLILNN